MAGWHRKKDFIPTPPPTPPPQKQKRKLDPVDTEEWQMWTGDSVQNLKCFWYMCKYIIYVYNVAEFRFSDILTAYGEWSNGPVESANKHYTVTKFRCVMWNVKND